MRGGAFGLIFGLPEAPTAGFVLVLVLVLGWLLLRAYTRNQQIEIDGLRTALDKQSERHHKDIAELNTKVDRLEVLYDDERGLKHKALNDVAKTVMALDLVERLAASCTCGALDPLNEIIRRLVAELSTLTRATAVTPMKETP